MRMIDADALWEKMYKYSDNEGAKMPYGDDDSLIHRDSACFLIEEAPTIDPEPHWILCSDRLPEIGEYVLCMIKQRYKGQFHICHYVDKDKYISHPYVDWRHNGFPDVVAWMPLPEPWKGE